MENLFVKDTILPGSVCASGGTRIKSGVDKNHNDTLDQNEVSSQQVVCNQNKQPAIWMLGAGIASFTTEFVIKPQLLEFNITDFGQLDLVKSQTPTALKKALNGSRYSRSRTLYSWTYSWRTA